jgi:membrane-associated phospholipid phosphatase
VLLVLLAGSTAPASDVIERIGNVGQIAVPASGLLIAAVHHDHQGALQLAEAFATTMAVVYILKPTVNRQRPDGGSQSFPSGHAASAFAGAAFLQRRYGWSYGIPACAAAAFVGYSRVEAKRHYTSDVVAGAALGIASNLVFTRKRAHVTVHPTLQARGAGLVVRVMW